MGTYMHYGITHPAEATFPPLPQTTENCTQLSDPGQIQGWVDLMAW